jgi:hypothetical protein
MGYMKVKFNKTQAKWMKHDYVNTTPYNINLIDSKDCFTHLTVLSANSIVRAHKTTAQSQCVVIEPSDIIIDSTGKRYVFSPEV